MPDSQQVFLIEPNEPFRAPWPAVVLSRGHYLKLEKAYVDPDKPAPELPWLRTTLYVIVGIVALIGLITLIWRRGV